MAFFFTIFTKVVWKFYLFIWCILIKLTPILLSCLTPHHYCLQICLSILLLCIVLWFTEFDQGHSYDPEFGDIHWGLVDFQWTDNNCPSSRIHQYWTILYSPYLPAVTSFCILFPIFPTIERFINVPWFWLCTHFFFYQHLEQSWVLVFITIHCKRKLLTSRLGVEFVHEYEHTSVWKEIWGQINLSKQL